METMASSQARPGAATTDLFKAPSVRISGTDDDVLIPDTSGIPVEEKSAPSRRKTSPTTKPSRRRSTRPGVGTLTIEIPLEELDRARSLVRGAPRGRIPSLAWLVREALRDRVEAELHRGGIDLDDSDVPLPGGRRKTRGTEGV